MLIGSAEPGHVPLVMCMRACLYLSVHACSSMQVDVRIRKCVCVRACMCVC